MAVECGCIQQRCLPGEKYEPALWAGSHVVSFFVASLDLLTP